MRCRFKQIELRATIYLVLAAFRQLSFGTLALVAGRDVQNKFQAMAQIAPMTAWGVGLITLGLLIVLALILDIARMGRIVLVIIAAITGFLGFTLLFESTQVDYVIVSILLLTLAAKDLIVVSTPFASPIDKLLEQRPEISELMTGK